MATGNLLNGVLDVTSSIALAKPCLETDCSLTEQGHFSLLLPAWREEKKVKKRHYAFKPSDAFYKSHPRSTQTTRFFYFLFIKKGGTEAIGSPSFPSGDRKESLNKRTDGIRLREGGGNSRFLFLATHLFLTSKGVYCSRIIGHNNSIAGHCGRAEDRSAS